MDSLALIHNMRLVSIAALVLPEAETKDLSYTQPVSEQLAATSLEKVELIAAEVAAENAAVDMLAERLATLGCC